MITKKKSLCGEWKLTVIPHAEYAKHGKHGKEKAYHTIAEVEADGNEVISATVPGNLELDLFKAGKVEDLFFGTNPDKIRRYTERLHCYYFTNFQVEEISSIQETLVFEGLDCYADVFLNGQLVGSFDNMLVEQSADVTGLISQGNNEILIHIKPAIIEATKYDYNFLVTAGRSAYEQLYVRKPAHMFGWDIMPRYLSAGIWRPVYLSFLQQEEGIREYYLCTTQADQEHAIVELFYATICDIDGDVRLTLNGKCGESVYSREIKMIFPIGRRAFELEKPKLWWPNNFGEQNRYEWELLLSRDGKVIDKVTFTQGLAKISLVKTDYLDGEGNGAFHFVVNSEKIFIKGTNWVPASPFHSEDKKRIPQMIALAEELKCNMIRCWGGNVYEDDLFYELCEQKGIMVWQDFGMACGKHPQDSEFAARIKKEATAVIKRLRRFACIALWSGDNEGDLRWRQWESIKMNPNDNVITRKILPETIMEHDPARSYLPSSPFFSSALIEKSEKDWSFIACESHFYIWGEFYKDGASGKRMLFASEFGTISIPSPDSMKKYISPDKLWPGRDINDEWLMHATSAIPETEENSQRPLIPFMNAEFLFETEIDSLAKLSAMSQIAACESDKYYLELFRSSKWDKTGMLWWNLVDGWPQLSDAVVDYYFDKKLPFYGLKASQQDVVLIMRDSFQSGFHPLVLVNDTLQAKTIHFKATDVETGEILLSGITQIAKNSARKVGEIPESADTRFILLEWKGDAEGRNHYLDFQKTKPKLRLNTYLHWLEASELYKEWTIKARTWLEG